MDENTALPHVKPSLLLSAHILDGQKCEFVFCGMLGPSVATHDCCLMEAHFGLWHLDGEKK
jgi:hypothetical protein